MKWPWPKVPKRRGLGYVANDHDPRDVVWHPKAAARPAKLPLITLEAFIPRLLDQGSTSSCVGQAIESTIAIRDSVLGLPYNPPSARAVYLMARASHGSIKLDDGTYPRAAWKYMAKHGCPLKKDWPWDPKRINDIPPSTLLLDGWRHAGFRYEHIFEVGPKKLDLIKLAIGEGHAVFFGTDVPESFMYHSGSSVYRPRGPVVGGHAMVIVGHRESDGALRILNSWGRSWGDGGLAWVSPEWASAWFRDLTVAYGWKAERAASEGFRR